MLIFVIDYLKNEPLPDYGQFHLHMLGKCWVTRSFLPKGMMWQTVQQLPGNVGERANSRELSSQHRLRPDSEDAMHSVWEKHCYLATSIGACHPCAMIFFRNAQNATEWLIRPFPVVT